MKKIILLLMLVSVFFGYSQENFESGVPPTGWVKASRLNGVTVTSGPGAATSWKANTSAFPAYEGAISAFIDSENIYSAVNNPTLPSTEEDWLISSQTAIPANGQLRFFVRQTILGDQNTIFKIMVSTTSQTDLSTFTQLKSFTEQELNDQDDNSVLEYDLRSADFPTALFGQNVYIAFVRQYTQTTTQRGGDRFLLDVVNVVQKCQPPTNLNVANVTSTSANLTWTAPTGQTNFQVVILPESDPFTPAGSIAVTGSSYAATGLTPGVAYKYYVRADCGNNNFSDWVGPLNFLTKPLGTYCNAPLVINGLPYQTTNNTSNFGNFFSTSQGTTCGATPAGTNFLAGNDVFYSYTPSSDCLTSVIMQATAGNSSVFVYSGCTNVGVACVAGAANTGTGVRNFTFNAVAGTQYIIVVSSAAATPTVGYTLTLQCIGCQATTAITGSATPASITTNSADLTWTNGGGAYTDYQVAIQTTQTLPTAASTVTNVTGNAYSATNLNAGTTYYFYVRGVCPGGDPTAGPFTQWYGPFAFSTKICNDADKCTYTFRLTDSANNGWNGARMEVRQNGFLIANTAGNTTIGQTYTSGAGPVDVTYQLCKNVPFTLEWTVAGTQPQQCIVTILNPFNQAIFVKPAGVGGAGQTVYTGVVDCENPRCDAPVMNVTATNITTNGATINWTNNPTPLPAGWSWDVYIYPTVGGTPPTAATIPTYDDITTFPFPTNIPLTPDTAYSVCVRVNCSPNPSEWSCGSFTTLPTCPKPTLQTVTAITTDAATLGWTPGTPTDNSWEVLLIPGCATPPPPPAVNPDLTGGALLFPTTTQPLVLPAGTLTPATIYYYYVRTVCPGNDKSTWTGPFAFNTLLCDAANKCNYKFLLTDTGGNGWNGGRIQVRQNCIVVATLGTQISGAGPTTVTVALCDDVPFDLFWSVAGTAPNEIGVTVQNPFVDNIYTYTPGTGTPLTSIYSGVAQCTPPTCPKPITLTTVSTSATTANVSWVETGTATQWEVYAIPTGTGAVPPVNGSPVSGVAPYYIANTNTNFQITGLTPGTRYTFYVRAICSSTDVSTWTIVSPGNTSPGTFITKPLNDECTAATPITVNPNWTCTSTNISGNTLGATNSGITVTGTNCTGTDDDVWYSFVATSNIQTITISNVVPSPANATVTLSHTLFSGTCGGTFTSLYCSNTAMSVATGLTPGQTYYIRVYTSGTNNTQSASFNICVGTPPPPATNDECTTAIAAQVNTLSECTVVTPGSIIGATASGQPFGPGPANAPCLGNPNDDVWFSFVANSGTEIVSLLNVAGSSTNLNHAVYSGTCTNLTRINCSAANSLQTVNKNLTVGATYYVRIWSNEAASQVTVFDLCIKPVSSCQNAAPFCGSSPANPYIYSNTTGLPDNSEVACLGSIPNPTFYTLHVDQTGDLAFQIQQYDSYDANNNGVGTPRDVDFVAWGPFTEVGPAACSQISFTDCSSCPNNQSNQAFYPFGNIVDCSYSTSATETLTINNAVAGQFYVILVTNFSDQPGQIRLIQTNFGQPDAGTTVCCDVKLGPDVTACADNVTLNALTGIVDLNNVPSTFQWFFNDSPTPIPGETGATIVVTQSGKYTVKGTCGLNPVSDDINVLISPPIQATTPADYTLCDDASNDGVATFNLQTLTPQVLGALNPADYTVTIYDSSVNATAGGTTGVISQTTPFTTTTPGTQILYIRVQSVTVATCFQVIPVNLVVAPLPVATFTYSAAAFCSNAANPSPTLAGVAGAFSATPSGLVVDATTGTIDLAASTPGTYTVTNLIAGTNGCVDVTATTTVTVTALPVASFTYPQASYCSAGVDPLPTLTGTAGTFTATPAGLVIDPATGLIDLSASTVGTYTVTNTIAAAGGCDAVTADTTVTVSLQPDATFTLASSEFCQTAANQPITLTGQAGTFTASPAGLSIDATTGEIVPTTSTPGVYTVTNTVAAANGCSQTTYDFTITITAPPVAAFSYSQTVYCSDGTDPSPVLTGTAGTFTSTPSGLVINPATGEVDLSASTVGTYDVTNTVAGSGSCAAVSATTQITITLLQDASFTYSSTQYCQTEANPSPIYTTGNAGVFTATPAGLNINAATGEINLASSTPGVYTVTNDIAAVGNCAPVSFTQTVTVTAQKQADFGYALTSYCNDAASASPVYTNGGVAGTFSATPSGLSLNTTTGAIDFANSTAGTYVVTNTIAADGACIADVETFTVIITAPYTGNISYSGSFCKDVTAPQNVTNTAPAGGVYSTDVSGLAIDAATGAIVPVASNAGTYVVSYTLPAHDGCDAFVTTTTIAVIPESPVSVEGECKDTSYVITALPIDNSFDPATSTFTWSGSPFTTLENPWMIKAGVESNGSWTVVVTTADGCQSTASFSNPFTRCGIQKGLSPNNDGSNDEFDLTAYNVKHLTIYNRYGTEVYQYANYTNQWKGQSNVGDALPTATYFYAIETYDGQQITGWIYIIR